MGIIFAVIGIITLAVGLLNFFSAEYVTHQTIAGIEMVIGALFLVGGGIMSAIEFTHKKTADLIESLANKMRTEAASNISNIAGITITTAKSERWLEKIAVALMDNADKIPPNESNAPGLTLYYYSDESGAIQGPHPAASMKRFIQEGRVKQDTPIAVVGTDEWLPLYQFRELSV